ncbi:glutamine synthetase [Methylomagnum ishizawai]|uniref:Glutamine synthetase n=1 Tax=Methylomagnum ishizawai TaxID=1760988 RepID=A0A1Y6D330_9GAMM|nr:hypothetical protein [Methylomagnum ishizawai]SMF96820.1 glutamine synthetase [Methylomagnum ishizawai]
MTKSLKLKGIDKMVEVDYISPVVADALAHLPHPTDVALRIIAEFNLTPIIAIEKEFYIKREGILVEKNSIDLKAVSEILARETLFERITPESGEGQFEISTNPTSDVIGLMETVFRIMYILDQFVSYSKLHIDGRSKPISEQPGNGIHVHLTLNNDEGCNVLKKDSGTERSESLLMLHVVAGLLHTLPDLMVAFAPTSMCYQRYIEPPFPNMFFSPTRISWGADNRSAAIRIPPSTVQPEARRIEHRVAGGSASIKYIISAILIGTYYGLKRACFPQFSKTYGLPSNPILGLPKLPNCFDLALNSFMKKGICLWKEL